MQIKITQKALNEGILRVWLRKIPEEGGMLFLVANDGSASDRPVGTASLYGSGPNSQASERTMLHFRLDKSAADQLEAGDLLDIRIEGGADGKMRPVDLDITSVE